MGITKLREGVDYYLVDKTFTGISQEGIGTLEKVIAQRFWPFLVPEICRLANEDPPIVIFNNESLLGEAVATLARNSPISEHT